MRLLPKPLEGWLDCLLTPTLKFLTLNENVYYSSNKPQVMLTRLSRDHPLRTTMAYCVALVLLPSCSPIFMKCEVMMEDRWATTSYTEGILINIQMLWAKVDMDLGETYTCKRLTLVSRLSCIDGWQESLCSTLLMKRWLPKYPQRYFVSVCLMAQLELIHVPL